MLSAHLLHASSPLMITSSVLDSLPRLGQGDMRNDGSKLNINTAGASEDRKEELRRKIQKMKGMKRSSGTSSAATGNAPVALPSDAFAAIFDKAENSASRAEGGSAVSGSLQEESKATKDALDATLKELGGGIGEPLSEEAMAESAMAAAEAFLKFD